MTTVDIKGYTYKSRFWPNTFDKYNSLLLKKKKAPQKQGPIVFYLGIHLQS